MSLVNPLSFVQKAREKRVAIAAFNVHNMETIQAVVEGAAEERSPVIVQTTPGTLEHAGIEYLAACVRVASDLWDIPVALHLDHCSSFETIVKCIRHGYTSVMIDGSKLPYEQNVEIVKKVVEVAHSVGVAVEAELGTVGGTEDDVIVDERETAYTVPEEAKRFVEATRVDTLAVAIGTAHGVYKGEPKMDFERLSAIRAEVDVPLVLHGASGVPDESIKEAIRRGISKVNIATELKIPMAETIKNILQSDPSENDPRRYMGEAKEAVKQVVKRKIRLCGCSGLAANL
ncbi:MAG: class II fructose-1,6-bisphosphate aldolase [Bacillota bacterium]|jgi:tagatose bisphosphate family class II aldolase|nr:class II fructose-1,6-bisphosphate aldolase [Bacillota bacterium]HOB92209.1 class II fructose-1,6-bisphosphate aldolase [Bacillota bacterium]HPZ54344.1 class II fructose-1,6-bisphosphate aldolase [Bacillota bacterium]HQD17627.1 class II fructose-1,6-bisphosphate aldolase [Bacillota bacterium]